MLLLTHGLFTRPWCLLEIRRAVRKRKPIVLLELTGPSQPTFSYDNALELLHNLEHKLPTLNPSAIDELRKHLGPSETLYNLQETVLRAFELGRSSQVLHLNINGYALSRASVRRVSRRQLTRAGVHAAAGRRISSRRS